MTIRDVLLARAGTSGHAPGGCLVIGEVALAHDGSLGLAHAFIDAVARAGADAVKFQTHIADAESTPAEPWRVPFSPQDRTRFDYWRRTAFTEIEWRGLKRHADERDLLFLSSPFSVAAARMLKRVGVAAWKAASGEMAQLEWLDDVLDTGAPVLLSTGMSTLAEIDRAVARVQAAQAPLAVMQCTSAYPCPPEKVGLNMLPLLRSRYGCAVGLSDHSGTIFPALAAVMLDAEVIEVHVTLSREMFGPDVAASLTTSELEELVCGVRAIERMRRSPIDKDALGDELSPLRAMFTKSVVACVPLEAGTVLRREHLAAKKPGTGIPARRLDDVVGARLRRAVAVDEVIAEQDLEEVQP